jgi:hypothetical protein
LTADSFLEIFRLEVSVLVVAVWLMDGNANAVEDVGGLLEDGIHFFQGTIASLREEEVDTGEHESVAIIVSLSSGSRKLLPGAGSLHNSENNVGLISNAVERNWGNHDDHEVEDPIGTIEKKKKRLDDIW